jgi:UDP-glucose 4-epimerase
MLRKPLVTGAGGFIGSNLAIRLSQMEEVESVYVVDLPNSPRMEMFKSDDKFSVLEVDLTSKDSLELLPEDASIVFALAALNGTGRFYTQPSTVLMNSTLPTLTIIEKYIRDVPIIYSSSSEVYASSVQNFGFPVPTNESVPVSFDDVHNLRWSYGAAKFFGEVALISAASEHNGKGAIVRYHNVYGPNMGVDHFVPDFIGRVKKGVFDVFGSEQTRSFLYIDDAVEGTIAAVKGLSPSVPIYHLGTNEELTILSASKLILKLMDVDPEFLNFLPAPQGSVSRRCADSTKAFAELSWSPVVSFETGIKMILNS